MKDAVIGELLKRVKEGTGREGVLIMFSNKLAITWRLFGDSGDYLAILEVIGVLLGHNRVTDTHYPCASVSTVAPVDVAHTYDSCHTWRSVFYRTPPIIDDDKKPQMNADERRYISVTEFVAQWT